MKIEEFVKLPAKEANEKLRKLFKDDKINVKQFKEISVRFLENLGYIKTDMGWFTQEEIDEQGIWTDGKEWFYDCEKKEISVKDGNKSITKVVDLPIKAIEYASKQKDIVKTYSFIKARDTRDILLSDLAEDVVMEE